MEGLAKFEEIHVISDIHMGGKPGFQILRETKRLANFVRWVAAQKPDKLVALALNGDVIDTLAEENISGYVAVDEAETTLMRIMNDASFAPVWDALADFVHAEKRTLIIIIGNHDIEIAFPNVQRLIVERLSKDDNSAKARIVFSAMGAGYGCMVGNARVFCTHGNEVDAWNFNRYEGLSRVARRLNAGLSLNKDEWIPNAGTCMVKDVMKSVKEKYAWIDLLKPEGKSLFGTLLTLDKSQASKLGQITALATKMEYEKKTEVNQRLTVDEQQLFSSTDNAPPTLESLLGPNLLERMRSAGVINYQNGDDMLLQLEQSRNSPVQQQFMGDAPLGTTQYVWDRLTGWFTGEGREEALRCALKDWLKGDLTFCIDDQDDTYKDVTAKLGPNIDFVITGHTHLARAINMGVGRAYFNSGTWVRLMRFTDEMLSSTASFKPVYDVLANGHMSAIDAATVHDKPLVLDMTTSVSISLENGRAIGRLNRVTGDGISAPELIKQYPEA